ncbi:DUF1343 domain-containing protein [Maribacter sp. ANRC-HE7]|uniref:DUF1343 domain-containing protein n=1 Tax=Maribacter aquimaris TaxID=2737171 RepID=A0ABR7UZP2_9FLAO|nr:DUF1343 domain-containing protein [Maribacter aquimaris]MBD0778065.1 DUF1343 domain-containing protein [Maribacter aquimaris]
MMKIATGLDVLVNDPDLQKEFKGNVALLCNNASIDREFEHAALRFKSLFGPRFVKLFGPQHGFSTDAQDNMIETEHFVHPYFNMPVYSLYSETRVPSDEMLEGIDHFFVDLQDVGCRMYTYIYSLTLLLEKCMDKDIEVIVLDRPNPLNGNTLEGNVLEPGFASFIGRHPIPVRHGMTIGEVGLMHQRYWADKQIPYRVIKMRNWERSMYFEETGLPWLLPSPNLARQESALTFPSVVLFEGTQLSEGRGTTQPLEIVGHPKIEPFGLYEGHLKQALKETKLKGVAIRPITFLPTFQKHEGSVCGGFQIHVTDKTVFQPWRVGQWLLRELYHLMGEDFQWLDPPYEYDYTNVPLDIINGSDRLRHWVAQRESMEMLASFEDYKDYSPRVESIQVY